MEKATRGSFLGGNIVKMTMTSETLKQFWSFLVLFYQRLSALCSL